LNRYPTKVVEGKTVYEGWIEKKPNLRIFGCEVFSYIVLGRRMKLDASLRAMIINIEAINSILLLQK